MAKSFLPALADGIISSQRICDETLHVCNSPKIKELNAQDYINRVIGQKPDIIKNNDFIDRLYDNINSDSNKASRKIVRSIQFSDLHIDHLYKVGAPSKCSYPICCRENGYDLPFYKDSAPAGKWGAGDCDVPEWTIKNMFKFIANNQDTFKTSFITWVGDNSAHNVWDNTDQEVYDYSARLTTYMKEAFGSLDIDFFPSLGNHDTWPVNI